MRWALPQRPRAVQGGPRGLSNRIAYITCCFRNNDEEPFRTGIFRKHCFVYTSGSSKKPIKNFPGNRLRRHRKTVLRPGTDEHTRVFIRQAASPAPPSAFQQPEDHPEAVAGKSNGTGRKSCFRVLARKDGNRVAACPAILHEPEPERGGEPLRRRTDPGRNPSRTGVFNDQRIQFERKPTGRGKNERDPGNGKGGGDNARRTERTAPSVQIRRPAACRREPNAVSVRRDPLQPCLATEELGQV